MKTKITAGSVIFNIINYTIFTIFVIICVFPFYYIFINTISDNDMCSKGQILLRPIGIHFTNYVQILKIKGLKQAAYISLMRTGLGTIGTLFGCSFLGYILSKKEMWMRKFWYRFVVVTMYFNAGIIPWYINMKNLGLTNNFWAYVLPRIVSPFYLILFKTYIEQIPTSLEESAQIDGAGYITRFVKIIIPLSKPILATIAVFTSVGHWNSFLDTLFLMTDSKLYTLQFTLYQYLNEVNAIAARMRTSAGTIEIDPARLLTPVSIRMTISMVVVLPILFIYPYFQRFFVKGIMIGAVKG